MKSVDIDVTKKPSEKQKEMLKKATKKSITFDEDCPKLTKEELREFKRANKK